MKALLGSEDTWCLASQNTAMLSPITSLVMTEVLNADHMNFLTENLTTLVDLIESNLPAANAPITEVGICPASVEPLAPTDDAWEPLAPNYCKTS